MVGFRAPAVVVSLLLACAGLSAAGPAPAGGPPPLAGDFARDFTFSDPPAPAPQAPFSELSGRELTLAELEGSVVLLNFWATWCAPCIREMPALDRLQAALADEGLIVAAVSQDRGGAKVVEPFLAELGLEHLRVYLDPKGKLARAFALRGLPTTLLVDRGGRVIGRLEGTAEWDGQPAVDLIRHYLAKGAG